MKLRSRNIRLAVVANRVRRASPVYQPLERFLSSLGLPFLARLMDSKSSCTPRRAFGIFELDPALAAERASSCRVEWATRVQVARRQQGDRAPRPSWFSNSRTG